MNELLNNRKFSLTRLCRRYADGSGAAQEPAADDPAKQQEPAKQEPAKQQEPAKKEPSKQEPAKELESTYTAIQLQDAKQKAVDDYKKHLEEAQDFEKMTADEKVVYLQNQIADEKLQKYAIDKLSSQEMPVELMSYVKGKDEKDTDNRITAFKAIYDKGVQAGVEKRFKANGYVPKGTAAGEPQAESKKRSRGVSVK